MSIGNDPFAEPEDTDKTIVRLNPGGRRPDAPVTETPAAPRAAPPRGGQDVRLDNALTGINPLVAAAAPILSLVGRIRNRAQHPDPAALREAVVREIQGFEARALQARAPAQSVKVARYALCATVDDVVLNTPWGGRSVWAQQSMVGTFHKETLGGDRFYELLAQLERDPASNRDMLEFIYACLSQGFEGRLRVEQGGQERHRRIRANLAGLIRAQRGPVEHDLSPQWRGIEQPHRPLTAWLPMWVAAGGLAAILGLGYMGFAWALSSSTERIQGQLAILGTDVAVELDRPAPPPPDPPPTPEVVKVEEDGTPVLSQAAQLKEFLAPEIAAQQVEVLESANTITVRITGSNIFRPASDTLEDAYQRVVDRIAEALNGEPGPVIIAGHSDSDPISTARFPSNLALSLARAESVMGRMAGIVAEPGRMTAEGRSDKEPIASNDTAEGKARNRRIEVILLKSG